MKKKFLWLLPVLLLAAVGTCFLLGRESEGIVYNNQWDFDNRDNWVLVWSDEFDGNKLNSRFWQYDVGRDKWGNEEPEYYTRGKNLEVKDGNLIITAKHNPASEKKRYTSSRIKTQNRVSFRYGRIEARIQLPVGQGMWPAFWMMGNAAGQKWPACGEIDIMENTGDFARSYCAIHWGTREDLHSDGDNTRLIDRKDWHVYAVEWNEKELRWYLDNECFFVHPFDKEDPMQNSFQEPFYLLLNVAVGGTMGGKIDHSIFPKSMKVDYVRVYSQQ